MSSLPLPASLTAAARAVPWSSEPATLLPPPPPPPPPSPSSMPAATSSRPSASYLLSAEQLVRQSDSLHARLPRPANPQTGRPGIFFSPAQPLNGDGMRYTIDPTALDPHLPENFRHLRTTALNQLAANNTIASTQSMLQQPPVSVSVSSHTQSLLQPQPSAPQPQSHAAAASPMSPRRAAAALSTHPAASTGTQPPRFYVLHQLMAGRCFNTQGKAVFQSEVKMGPIPGHPPPSSSAPAARLREYQDWPVRTDIACFWCGDQFDTAPLPMPVSDFSNHVLQEYEVTGVYGSFECMLADAIVAPPTLYPNGPSNIAQMAKRFFGLPSNAILVPAPPRKMHKRYGGLLGPDMFHHAAFTHVIHPVQPPFVPAPDVYLFLTSHDLIRQGMLVAQDMANAHRAKKEQQHSIMDLSIPTEDRTDTSDMQQQPQDMETLVPAGLFDRYMQDKQAAAAAAAVAANATASLAALPTVLEEPQEVVEAGSFTPPASPIRQASSSQALEAPSPMLVDAKDDTKDAKEAPAAARKSKSKKSTKVAPVAPVAQPAEAAEAGKPNKATGKPTKSDKPDKSDKPTKAAKATKTDKSTKAVKATKTDQPTTKATNTTKTAKAAKAATAAATNDPVPVAVPDAANATSALENIFERCKVAIAPPNHNTES